MYEYRQIITQMRQGASDRTIKKHGLWSRSKAKQIRVIAKAHNWLSCKMALPDNDELAKAFVISKPPQAVSSVEPYRDVVLEWHGQGIRKTVIHRALVNRYNFTGSYCAVLRFIQHNAPKEVMASTPLQFEPARAVQVDFGKGPEIVDDNGKVRKSWIFVMTLCFSRHMYVEIVPDQTVMTWLGCHRRGFEFFGGVPEKVIIDNAKCAITKACIHDPQVQRSYADFAEHYGFMIAPCPPREPQMKGRVESGVKYVKGSFLPLRTFESFADANQQAKAWVLGEAGNRKHGSTYQQPLTAFAETERYLLKALPAVPGELAQWKKVKVHADCHVQFDRCRYSVPYEQVGQTLWLRASETSVRIYRDDKLLAQHSRSYTPGRRNTIDGHLPPNGQAYLMQSPTWCRAQAAEIGEHCQQVVETLFEDKVLDHLRAVQAIVRLAKTYGNARLNAACKRAIAYQSCHYKTIKSILQTGSEYDQLPQEEAFDTLANAYTHGRFIRSSTQH